ncbi:DUF4880 domain-containing protein [Aestuariicella hydrocarbonica]|uniref:DUF4880 domain-containing protein n=1 Tax=Pseudomaricurvus hydrocarbonicus TaxID=1470433 RepID=A0A9E5T1W1_9GAMM|nr:FecR domain-containing protein [Aestuariicella hydrocarbonica]NHO67186.1 DUF4880 domain-containing protein [Aestuariicella hydrocarbonica]
MANNVVALPTEESRYDEAARWIVRLDESLTTAEQQELRKWLAKNPENQLLLEDMASLWDKMDSLSRLSNLFSPKPSCRPRSRFSGWGVAASLCLGILVGLVAWHGSGFLDNGNQELIAHENVYQTSIGERSTVRLVDGSSITLNTNSLVEVEFTDSYRLISLIRGEIHVKVAKDEKRPLAVMANGKVAQAVGTEFNVEITDEKNIELVVTEGKVRVAVLAALPEKQSVRTALEGLPVSAPEVSAGQQLIFGEVESDESLAAKVAEVASEDIEVKLSWQSGNLVFRGESLEEAVKEVARYTSVEFIIQDESLRQIRVGGHFKAGDVESLIAALEDNFNIVARRKDDKQVVLSSK